MAPVYAEFAESLPDCPQAPAAERLAVTLAGGTGGGTMAGTPPAEPSSRWRVDEATRGPVVSDIRSPVLEREGALEGDREASSFELGRLFAEVKVGEGAELFRAESRYWEGSPGADVLYSRSYDDAFVVSGRADPGSGVGFTVLALRGGNASAVLQMRYPLTADGDVSEGVRTLVNRIACTTSFRGASLPCTP
jgi:hypothetical protein